MTGNSIFLSWECMHTIYVVLLCDNIDSRNTFLIYQFRYSYCYSNCSLVYMYCTLCVKIFVLSFQLFFLLTMQKINSLRPNKLADICIFMHIEFCEHAVIAIVNILEAKRTICLGFFFSYSADDWKMEIADERTKMSWPEWKKLFTTIKTKE